MIRVASRVLVAAGLALLAWCAAVAIDARIAQWQAREALAIAVPPPPVTRTPARLPATAAAVPAYSRGQALATLDMPRIRLSSVVLEGSDTRTLRRGPGHLEHTAVPGEPGNIVVAGHRDTFFKPLRDVSVGDEVTLTGPYGRLRYRVAWTKVVGPTDLSVIAPTREDALTLITCFPFWVFGNAPDRFVVRAVRIDDAGRPAATPNGPRDAAYQIGVTRVHTADALIRDAVGRFRDAYNARLAMHRESRPAPRLAFDDCLVVADGAQATVTCRTTAASATDIAGTWVFSMQRIDGAWRIRSVSTR